MNALTTLTDLLPKLAFDDDKAGGALVIFKDGECVLDTAFGQANATDPWTTRTLSVNFSIGKGVMATLIASLVSQGVLDYDKPIAHYWADFAQNGKGQITLMDVLVHRANLFNIRTVTNDLAQVGDWHTMLSAVAAMPITAPSPPKSPDDSYVSAYSALVSGWVLGGVIEQATGRGLQAVLDEYLACPLGVVGELYYGLPSYLYQSIALPERLFFGENNRKPILKPDSKQTLDFYNNLPIANLWGESLNTQAINKHYFDPSKMNLVNYKDALLVDGKTPINYHAPELIGVPIPAANGVSTAHALAVMYAMHANNGIWQDKQIISKATLDRLRVVRSRGADGVMPADMYWRAGFHRLFSVQSAPCAYGHMGYNGSVAFCDPERALAVAFIHNFDTTMLNDVRQFVVSELALQL